MAVEEFGRRTWTSQELRRDFEIIGFCAPYVAVIRKVDGRKGSLQFRHTPREYWGWIEDRT